MYAVIEVAGKQFRVAKGEYILVDQPENHPVTTRVLMVVDGGNVITDRSKLDKASVATTVAGTVKEKTHRAMKFKPKDSGRSSKRMVNHRRSRTKLTIGEIKF